jgi:hypothetical protein
MFSRNGEVTPRPCARYFRRAASFRAECGCLSTRWLIGSLRSLGMNDCSPQTHILVQQILSIGLAITLPFEPLRRALRSLSLLGNAQKTRERQVTARVVVDCRCPKAATHWPWVAGVADPKNPMVGRFAGCCASAVSGHAARDAGRLLRCGISAGLMPASGHSRPEPPRSAGPLCPELSKTDLGPSTSR